MQVTHEQSSPEKQMHTNYPKIINHKTQKNLNESKKPEAKSSMAESMAVWTSHAVWEISTTSKAKTSNGTNNWSVQDLM